jgi:hypothetical protein
MSDFKNKILIAIFILLSVLFAISLFKNIAYPLLWNDEAETAMFATRILEYGYPKVHDGKNILFLLELPLDLGIKERNDAYIGTTWGHYYFATIGAFLAKNVVDIYQKTALARIPFAIIGLFGLFILALLVSSLFKKNLTTKLSFINLFILLELLSISLILHLREMRYCSIVIFLSACTFYTYINYRLFKKIKIPIYIFVMVLLLLLLFNTFIPLYFVFIITIGLYECLEFFKKRQIKDFVIGAAPLLISFISIIPLLAFFETFRISNEFARLFNVSSSLYFKHFLAALDFFQKYEFLYLVLILKVVLAALWFYSKILKIEFGQKMWISNFLSLFFFIYILVIARAPLPVIYQRYFIVLQPILITILLLDVFIAFEMISRVDSLIRKWRFVVIILLLIFVLSGLNKIGHIKNHIYELSYRYRGPLDFVIPYIKSNYANPEHLVIATNYEECAYMYYLGSKVIIGYVGNNLEEDLKVQPDIIIFRKRWAYTSKPQLFNHFFQNEKYKKISFPVFDYPVNNIPELDGVLPHLYKTKMAKNDRERLDIYVKFNLLQRDKF